LVRARGFAMRAPGEPLSEFEYEAEPGPGEALVEVVGCGVCHTDLGFLDDGVPTRHPLPLVLGHEVAGRVVAAGSGAEERVGESVVVPAVLPCGDCDPCRRRRGGICRRQVFPGNDVHGGFATHLVVPARALQAVPLRPGAELARLSVVADAVSTAYQAVVRSGLESGDVAVFVGAGGVGGFGVQVAAALGARVVAVDVDPVRLAALDGYGAAWTIDARGLEPRDLKKTVRGGAKERGWPGAEWKVFETSGTAAGQAAAFALLTFGGHLGVVGYHPGEVTVRLSNLMALEARAEGTWGCLPEHFPAVLDLVLSERVAVAPFVELHPLDDVGAVLDRLRRGELEKRAVLLPDPTIAR